MKEFNNKFKQNILLSTYIVILAFILLNLDFVTDFIFGILGIFSPFIIAIAIAFVLNLLMNFFETRVLSFMDKSKSSSIRSLKRPVAITITLLSIIGLFVGLVIFVVPQFASSVSTLLDSVPQYIKSFENLLSEYVDSSELFATLAKELMVVWKDLLQFGGQLLGNSLSSLLDMTMTFTNGVINFILALIFAIYMLYSKETLIRHIKKLLYAFLDKKTTERILRVGKISNITFSKFITGQCVEAIILGFLCFVGMTILSMPYALLISVLIGVTALIPIFGAFIGTVPAIFIILIIDPVKALWFIVFILVLQQLENKLIYPKVVGKSIGLSAIWVMLAMIVGGSSLGLLGMIIGIPVFAVLYQLLTIITNKRLNNKKIDI
ncbi:AI-2E family transporter [Clostridium sp.]|uniref:AI-2E family transporter n=1 Tax=Clostridium sp. TaxID=1506 RepID=UPI003F3FF890